MSRWRSYLDGLEHGIAIYPDVACKASVTRSFYEFFGSPKIADDVPSVVRQLAESPPPVNVFVPEVHARVMYLAMADVLGLEDDALVERCRDANRALLSGPLYKAIFMFVSPERMVKNLTSRWYQFHRGTELIVEHVARDRCTVSFNEPKNVGNLLLGRMHATALLVGLEKSGARDIQTTTVMAPTGPRITAVWKDA